MPLEIRKPDRNIRPGGICIYARGGVGKTTLVGTMPGKGLLLDVPQIEGGTFVLADKADRIDIVEIEEWDAIDEAYWNIKKGTWKYNWVAIDSITAMQELAKRKVIKERNLDADPHKITLPEWGEIGQLVGELVYRFRTLPIWTIWVAQERQHGNDDDGSTPRQLGPDVIASALRALQPSMMLVGRLAVAQNGDGRWERTLRVGPHPSYITKVRALPGKQIPDVLTKPNLNEILRYLLADGKKPKGVKEDFSNAIVLE